MEKTIDNISREDALKIITYLSRKFNYENLNVSDNQTNMEYEQIQQTTKTDKHQTTSNNLTQNSECSPPNRKRKLSTATSSTIKTHNRYEVLSDENFSDSENENEEESPQSPNISNVVTKQVSAPPLMLREKEKWLNVSNGLKINKINYKKAKNVSLGVLITPNTLEDYHKMRKFFDNGNIKYFTHDPKSEKPLKIRN